MEKSALVTLKDILEKMQCINMREEVSLYTLVQAYNSLPRDTYYTEQLRKTI